MDSIASNLLAGFGVTGLLRPATTESVVVGLVSILAKHDLLKEAVELIEARTDLIFEGNLTTIKSIATHSDISFLYKYPDAIALLLHITPTLAIIDGHSEIGVLPLSGTPRARKRSLVKSIEVLNSMDMGFKLYVPSGDAELALISYETDEELRDIIVSLELPTQIQDRLML